MRLPSPPSFETLAERYGERYKWMLLIVVGIGTVAGGLSTSSFNVAINALAQDFGLGQERVQWAMTGFMAAMTLSMLPAPWLLDRIGFRKLFMSALILLVLSSIAGSLATSFPMVVAARVLQGCATGVLQPLSALVILRLFPPHLQGQASGLLMLGLGLTPAVAPAFGGVLIDRFGWESIFYLNLPFGLLALLAGIFLLPSPREIRRHPFDWLGAGLLSGATLAMVEGIASLQHSGLVSVWTLGSFLLAAVLVVGFVLHARRARQPIISLDIFRSRTFSMGTLVSFTYGFGLFGSTYLIPVFLQHALGYTATAAGSVLIPGGIALILSTPVAGRMVDKFSPQQVTIWGLVLFGLSFFIFFALGGKVDYTELIVATVLGRIGLGLILPALNLATVRDLAAHQHAQSSVVVSYARQLGGVFGVAVIAVFTEWRVQALAALPDGLPLAYAQGFLLIGLTMLAAVCAAWRMKGQPAAQA
ncbi:DHA2 family efflux MFS transporter permease subunit [Thauera butanivorans]|uniref:DHA2 family efflux MFS transporter permease subunit n=1 Tax=Thauera butanivorans TaxID=86174 RepID=UPI003AB28AF3